MKVKHILNKSELSKVWKHTQEHDSGTVSAFRSNTDCGEGRKITMKENTDSNHQLKLTLLGLGYGVTAIKGTYIENYGSVNENEVREDAYLVVDLKDAVPGEKGFIIKPVDLKHPDKVQIQKISPDRLIIEFEKVVERRERYT